jgi:hypothetical protein
VQVREGEEVPRQALLVLVLVLVLDALVLNTQRWATQPAARGYEWDQWDS